MKDIQNEVQQKYGLTVSLSQCWRAKNKAIGEIEAVLKKHFSRLYDYAEEIEKSNPDSRVAIDVITIKLIDKL